MCRCARRGPAGRVSGWAAYRWHRGLSVFIAPADIAWCLVLAAPLQHGVCVELDCVLGPRGSPLGAVCWAVRLSRQSAGLSGAATGPVDQLAAGAQLQVCDTVIVPDLGSSVTFSGRWTTAKLLADAGLFGLFH